mgnify:CR=1 FL=1
MIFTDFSKIKYNSIKFIKDGGWHFSNIKSPEEIEHKLKSYLHHREFDVNPLSVDQISKIINDKRAIYNLNVDKSDSKWRGGDKLEKFEIYSGPTRTILSLKKSFGKLPTKTLW